MEQESIYITDGIEIMEQESIYITDGIENASLSLHYIGI